MPRNMTSFVPGGVRAPSRRQQCSEQPEDRRSSAATRARDRPAAAHHFVIRPVNCSDQLLETAVSPEIFRLLRLTLPQQVPRRPVEKALLIDSMFRLQRLLHAGYDHGGAGIHVQEPAHYGDLPEHILGLSQEITDRAVPDLSRPDNLLSVLRMHGLLVRA